MATGPTKDVKEFQFKVSGQLRVFSSKEKLDIEKPVKLVATSSKYGLVFVGTPSGLTIINSGSILNSQEIKSNPLTVKTDFPRRLFSLPSQPSHVDVSADNELLAVVICIQNIPVLQIFAAASCGSMNIVKKVEMRMSNTVGVKAVDLQWNPGVPNMISAVMSDGSVVLFEVKDTAFTLNSLPPTTQAKCLCWSPKGKQVVIGSADGSLTQYKPDLKQVKTFLPPFPSASIVSVHWPSSFQFIAAYVNTSTPNDRPAIVVVNAPKGTHVSYIRYDDICYGSLSKRPEYYFIHQQNWNIMVIGCGDSMELSVLGLEPNTVNWIHWKQDDSTRAELPLTEDKDDTHNLGITLDTSPFQPIQLNDSLSVGPMPVVLSLSHDGVLCFFTELNLLPGVPPSCTPPQPLPDQSGLHLFTSTQGVPRMPSQIQPVNQAAFIQPSNQIGSTFSKENPVFSFPSPAATTAPQVGGLFSQATSSFSVPSFGNSATFNVAFSSPNANLMSSSSPFSLTTSSSMFPTPTLSFSSLSKTMPTLTPSAGQALATVPQPAAAPIVSSSHPGLSALLPQPTATVTPLTTNEPLLTTSSVPSFGNLAKEGSLQLKLSEPAKQDENNSIKPTFPLVGFGPQPVVKDQIKTEVKPLIEPTVPATSQPTPNKQEVEEKVDAAEIDNAAYLAAINDELKSFREEYDGLRQYLNSFSVKVGEEKAKGELCTKVSNYIEFNNELIETTQAQCTEAFSLKMCLLDVISCIQFIKTKQNINQDCSLTEMREAEEMDPVGKHWCKRIEQRLYNLQAQVKQAVEQIESIKDASKQWGLYLPTLDAVLQTLTMQNRIVNVQKGVISNIEDQLALKVKQYGHRKEKIIHLDKSSRNKIIDDSQLTKLAQKLLQTKLEASEDSSFSYRECSQKMIAKDVNSSNRLTPSKEHILREWHKNHQIIYSKVKPTSPSISDLNATLERSIKLSSKKLVSFSKEKAKLPEAVAIKPVPTSLGRSETKNGQLNRNLFPATPDKSVLAGITPLRQDVKERFQSSVTSTPLPSVLKKDIVPPLQSVASPVKTESLQSTAITSTSISTKEVLPFGPVVTASSQLLVSVKTTTAKPSISFGVSQNPPIFNFGTINKENTPSDTQTSVASSSASLFSKPISKASNVFSGLTQPVDKKSGGEETVSSLNFNFESVAQSLKGSLETEKQSTPCKVETAVAPLQPLTYGSVTTTTSSSVVTTAAGALPTTSVPLFSFNQTAPFNTTVNNQQTPTVVEAIKPFSSFSFNSAVNPIKPTSNVVTTSQTTSSFSFSTSAPPVTEAAAGIPLVSTALVSTTSIPVTSVTPNITPVAPSSTTSSTVTTTAVPVLVSSPAAKPTVTAAFGATTLVASSATSVKPTTTPTTTAPVFTTPNTFENQPFKPPSTTATTFGSSAFGLFTSATPATSAPAMFGSSAAKFSPVTSTAPVFGLPISSAPTSAPIFNQVTTAATSPFGQTITSTQAPASPFSQTTPSTATNSPFSQPTTTAFSTTTSSFGTSTFGSGSVFSSLSNPTFGGVPPFGTPTTSQSVFGSPAAATTTTASSLFSTPLFGQTTPGGTSLFGGVSSQASPFSTATPSTQAPASPFGSTSPPANPFFNQLQPSVFGQSPSQGNFGSSGGSLFGGSSSFGSSPQGGQFQPSGSSIFGSSSGPFSSGGGQTVSQTGFGAPPSFQTPKATTGGFGNAPVFGSSPSFGGAPAFGSPASFGSPNKVFGSPAPIVQGGGTGRAEGGFGGQSNMFESLANQNTMSFGNLAQTQQPQNMTSGFGTPPTPQPNNPSFGGNAFSSWR